VGLPVNGVRRVAGLRREEVAMLAGISSDYYLRLEQGRDRNPSMQVLEALARVLQLDQAASNQAATCWLVLVRNHIFTSNAGSGSLTTFQSSNGGTLLSSLGNTATDPGTVDGAASPDGRFIYVQTGLKGIVDEFAVSQSGALTAIGTVEVPGAVGGEGIVAG